VRTDETRKWDERTRGGVRGMETLISEALGKIKSTRPLKISQTGTAKKSKLITLLKFLQVFKKHIMTEMGPPPCLLYAYSLIIALA
jgi:hypothetical protein